MGQKKGADLHWIKRCNAHGRITKKPCRGVAVRGKTKCRRHGGKSKEGWESPQLKTGIYTQLLQGTTLGERLEAREGDTLSKDLDEQIRLIDGMLEVLLIKFRDADNTAEGMSMIKDLKKTYEQIQLASLKGDSKTMDAQFYILGEKLNNAHYSFSLVEEIQKNVKLRKDLVDSQTKRDFQLDQMMKADEVKVIVTALKSEIRTVIYDEIEDKKHAGDILIKISQGLARILGGELDRGASRALPER